MKKKEKAIMILGYFFLLVINIIILFPIVILLSTSLKDLQEIRVSPYTLIPESVKWENYIIFFQTADWGKYFYNTAYIAIITTVISIITNSMAGYAFARLKFIGKDFLFKLSLIGMMIPMQTVMIPIYMKVKTIPFAGGNNIWGQGGYGLLNSTWGVMAPLLAGAFGLFMCRQFFLGFPVALDDAAKIDGCSAFRAFAYIYIPLSKPMLATLAILKFTDGWNQYTWPLVITNSDESRTVQLALSMFRGSAVIQWDLLMAGTVMISLPVLVIFLFLQKYYVQGLINSGIKG